MFPAVNRRRYELRRPGLDERIEALVRDAALELGALEGAEQEQLRQILVSAVGLVRDRASTGELRMVNSALKELRHSFRVFAPYRHLRKVAVFGSARTEREHADWKQARSFAERIVERGWMVITGAGDGIMGAAQGGAGRELSFGVNIRLPFEQRANATIARDPKLINFRYFFTRKVTFVKESHALALFPGGFGTHDEGFEALTLIQTGKSELIPVVFIDAPGSSYWKEWAAYVDSHLRERGMIDPDDLRLFRVTDRVDDAIDEITRFYRNYHSSRWVRDRLVLRVQSAPRAEALEALRDEFRDLLVSGRIEVGSALEEERGDLPELERVILRFDRRSHGRLRLLIDRLNALPAAPQAQLAARPHQIIPAELSEAEAEREEADLE
jgi:hypothetical protein